MFRGYKLESGFFVFHRVLFAIINPPHPFSIVLNRFWYFTQDLLRTIENGRVTFINNIIKPGRALPLVASKLLILLIVYYEN